MNRKLYPQPQRLLHGWIQPCLRSPWPSQILSTRKLPGCFCRHMHITFHLRALKLQLPKCRDTILTMYEQNLEKMYSHSFPGVRTELAHIVRSLRAQTSAKHVWKEANAMNSQIRLHQIGFANGVSSERNSIVRNKLSSYAAALSVFQ